MKFNKIKDLFTRIISRPNFDTRYTIMYFIYIGDKTLDEYKKHKTIVYSGLITDLPPQYKSSVEYSTIKPSQDDKYIVVIDNWQ